VSAGLARMDGRVCVVTGATNGIGKETALGLARLGATVVIVARNVERAAQTANEIERETGNRNVEMVIADFTSLAAVRAAAAEIARRYPAVHVLVNNAGRASKQRMVSADGFEMTFAVNHLAPFLLTRELLPLLRAGAPSRIVNVASAGERSGEIRFDDMQSERNYRGFNAYAMSKLANVLFTYELASRLEGTGITANCLHPGTVATDLLRQIPKLLFALISPFLLTPAKGARTVLFLAASPRVQGVSGGYFQKCRAARSSRRSYDVETRKRLWGASETMVDAHVAAAPASTNQPK
jgi:NAD(P)-dependent dehydrogenase (short-subunit alcohol dehydrogenase family)